ncbi:unnamed protein product [Albugo candida]|uniref:Uncharacterized protein n=1 Tax=Albugo candida TaxID=65357 RepID=A0A024G5Q5_9STRA|nr:unnamed protein product [Albugo candida]|eukprot:CCI42092.1 unnamed protein product [Albugo candida]
MTFFGKNIMSVSGNSRYPSKKRIVPSKNDISFLVDEKNVFHPDLVARFLFHSQQSLVDQLQMKNFQPQPLFIYLKYRFVPYFCIKCLCSNIAVSGEGNKVASTRIFYFFGQHRLVERNLACYCSGHICLHILMLRCKSFQLLLNTGLTKNGLKLSKQGTCSITLASSNRKTVWATGCKPVDFISHRWDHQYGLYLLLPSFVFT